MKWLVSELLTPNLYTKERGGGAKSYKKSTIEIKNMTQLFFVTQT